MSENSILATLDATNLRNCGLLHASNTTASQRLHKRRLNRTSDEEYHDIPLSTPISSSEAQDAFVTIPTDLVSLETLLHVGFSNTKATELWNRWTNWPTTGPRREIDPDDGSGLQVCFLDYILGNLENNIDSAGDDDLEWRACLNTYGIDKDTQDAIMDTHFRDLRLSSSCLYWVKDTIKMRYAGLQDIQRTSRVREMELRRVQESGAGGTIGISATSSAIQG